MDHVSSEHKHDARHDAGGHEPDTLTQRSAKRGALLALCLLGVALFVALGVWQIERRAWKLDLIARVEARVHALPRALPETVDPKADEYLRVRVSGQWVPGRATFVQALTDRGAGFWVMAPLRTERGTVLVNRGFVPARRAQPIEGAATVTGLLRASEPGGGFLRANDAAADRWYSRDVEAIAQARGLGRVEPYFIDVDAAPNPGGLPVGGLTVIAFRNNHLVYALTWFALAGLSLVGALLLMRQR